MNISIGKITKIVDKDKRIVTVSSIYGQGDFSCEVLFSPIQVSVGNYVVVLSVDPTSNSKNYAIPLIRHANYPYDLNSIRINYFNSEITLKDKEISIYTVDDGRERVQAPVDPNDDIFNYYIYANSKGAKNKVNREVHYTHINLDKGGIEIGKFENGQKYSLLQMDKRRIELLKYAHDGYEEEEDFAYEDNVGAFSESEEGSGVDSGESSMGSGGLGEGGSMGAGGGTAGQSGGGTSGSGGGVNVPGGANTPGTPTPPSAPTPPEPPPLPEPPQLPAFGPITLPKKPKLRGSSDGGSGADINASGAPNAPDSPNTPDASSASGTSGSSNTPNTPDASSASGTSGSSSGTGLEAGSSLSSSGNASGIESVNESISETESYSDSTTENYMKVVHTEDEPDVLVGEADFVDEANRVLVQQPDPPKRTGLNGRIIMLNDAIKVQRVGADANIEDTKIVDEIVLTDEKIEIDFRNEKNKKRTAIEIDKDGIRFRINKDDESVIYVRLDIYDYMFNLIMSDDDDKRIGLITMNMEGINIISYKDGQAASNIKVFEDKINIKSGGEMEIQSSKLKVPGNPVPSAIPMGGFCQIKFCPITGLPHTTPVLQTDRSVNIEDLELDS